ncbi:TauD/TfdA family dioxygenase [Kitasatospora kifunensis]|uniref:Fe(II)/alpha-ketoglutarate-dependent arginine beta-hydroxylase n=1 Tax=Kitasatospora kifunensis TaxID=58351 RepID=A0A7W7VZM0_KITKI|nr:TauD/TfdA family dioxygenase [Kitasatospora kifunensis]MBB4927840.1 Fe(II)/alpha-ketoglutarate-dependent arginine beta-hydroxylase [Kitasatospora kifunensis]
MARYVLSDEEKHRIARIADDFLAAHPAWAPLEQASEIRVEAERLPLGVRQFLVTSRAAEDAVIALANLPVDENLVPTPASWQVAEKEGAAIREELVLLLLASVLGDPFAWSNQQNGRLVHDVCPAKGQESSLTSASSQQQLTLHTEDVFHACRGDYVALMCLRNPDRVGTTVAMLESVDFPQPLREVLHQDRFRFFPDDSHTVVPQHSPERPAALEDRPHEVASVLFGPQDSPYLRIDADFTSPVAGDAQAEQAMNEAAQHLADAAERVVLSPGEAAFIDNYRVIHGRDTFTPRYDGTDRWLKRTSMVRDLRRTYVHTKSRSRLLA